MSASHATPQAPSRRNHSLRHRLDLISGALVLCIAMIGCVALELIQQRQQDAKLLHALYAQERLAYELNILAESALSPTAQDPARAAVLVPTFHHRLEQLEQSLRVIQHGGALELMDGTIVRVKPTRDALIAEHVDGTMAWIAQYRAKFDLAAPGELPGLEAGAVRREELIFYGQQLHTFLRGLVASVESRSFSTMVQASHALLLLMVGGILCFLLGVLVLRRCITTPLHRMADGIAAMRQTGRLVKLPVLHANEMGVVAAGFNGLAEQVEDQKRRLREHIVELQRVNAQLDQLVNLKEDFLATINHQLRTPLTAIMEGLNLLSDGTTGALTEDQRALLRTVEGNAAALRRLVEQALDFSMLNSDRRSLKRQPSDLAALLQDIRASWQAVERSRTIRVACGALPPVYMDPGAIHDVLDHLLRNALRHAPERSEVVVEAATQDGMAEVSVRDEGPGLSDEQLARLFQPFVHLQTPDSPGSEGSGLGLAFCRQLIERHRGTIRAESSGAHGTRVIFTLPVASMRFLMEEALRCAQDDAAREHGQVGLLMVTAPVAANAGASDEAVVRQAEAILRRNTHRGDRFIWIDASTVAIVAVTDGPGLHAMASRLQLVLDEARLPVVMTSARCPADGETIERLVDAARRSATSGPASAAPT